MIQQHRLEPSKLLARYAVAISLLVVFVLGGHGLQIMTSKQGVLDEEIINVSGRQRMLSQRIILLAERYTQTGSERYSNMLVQSLDVFESSHAWLMENAVPAGSTVAAHYIGATGAALDARSKDFVDVARTLVTEAPGSEAAQDLARQIEDFALVGLLSDLNAAVNLFEDAANTRAQTLDNIQMAVVAATLIVLLLEILLIFYPAHRAMAAMIERLKFQAWHDELTGLANRARFIERVREMIDGQPGKLDRMFVLALDLDGFKDVNDTLGHPVGDQVLRSVAQTLDTQLSSASALGDYVFARVGGDEFVICGWLPEGNVEDFAHALGDDLIAAVETPIRVHLDADRTEQCMVGVSIGYALGDNTKDNVEVFLSNADIALYESKRRGKGVTTAFLQGMRDAAERRHYRTQEIKIGVKDFEYCAFYQPQINLESGQIAGIEALARWKHPTHGLVGPVEFIDLAQDVHVLSAIDGQIILNALEAYTGARRDGFDLGKLSINASEKSLKDPEFCNLLFRVAKMHDVLPCELTVEVLEDVLIKDDSDDAIHTIRKLSRAGFGVAVDDFGTGQSSLSRISHLDVSAIKIDRSLTAQVGAGNMNKILRATAAMAKGLGAELVAEGIETEAQCLAMKSMGVDVGQGFLWSKPLSITDLKGWVGREYPPKLKLASGDG